MHIQVSLFQQASARNHYSSMHIFWRTVDGPRTTGCGGAVRGAANAFTTVCNTRRGIQFVGPRLAATPLAFLIGQASFKCKV